MLVFSFEEPGAAARMVKDFASQCEQIEVKALSLDGEYIAPEQLKRVASLPSKDEAIAQLMATMLAPVTQLARTIQEQWRSGACNDGDQRSKSLMKF